MAIGDMVADILSLTSGQTLTVQPTGTQEWVIHNIYRESGVSILRSDATATLEFETVTGEGWHSYVVIHVNNTDFLAIRNDQITTKKVGYDGVITKL